MAIAAFVGVDSHWVCRRMAPDTERGVKDMAKTSRGVVDMEVYCRCGFILVAV